MNSSEAHQAAAGFPTHLSKKQDEPSRESREIERWGGAAEKMCASAARSNRKKSPHLFMPPFSSLPPLPVLSALRLFLSPLYGWASLGAQPAAAAVRAQAEQDKRGICELAEDQEKIANSKTPALHLVFMRRVDLLPC